MIKYFTLAVFLILAGYGTREAWPLIAGPILSIESPMHNESVAGGIVTITGKAVRAIELSLNGTSILREKNGDFSTTLTFPRGGSILTFKATDRFGRIATETRSIFIP